MSSSEVPEAEIAYDAMFEAWFTSEVFPRIDDGRRNFRLAPPLGAEIWEHHKEDRFYRILRDKLSPYGFRAVSAKPLKKEPRHVTLIMAEGS